MKKKILVVGHSHLNALKSAPSVDDAFHFVSFRESAQGGYEDKDAVEFEQYAHGDFSAVIFLLRGNVPIELGLVRHPVAPFDFCLREAPDWPLDPGARVLPDGLMAAVLRRHLAPELAQLKSLAAVFGAMPCYRAEPPPPLPTAYVEQFPAGFVDKVGRHGVAPVMLRKKLWRLNGRLVRAHCAQLGVGFLPVPSAAIDADGCLAPSYWRQDPAHANHLYGDLVLDQIRALNLVTRAADEPNTLP